MSIAEGSDFVRPRTVSLVAGFLFLAAFISFVVGTSLLFPSPVWKRMWDLNPAALSAFVRVGPMAGYLLWALGLVSASAGAGLFRGRRWAWRMAFFLFTVNGLGDAFTILRTRDLARGIPGLLVAGAFAWMLSRRASRRYCGVNTI